MTEIVVINSALALQQFKQRLEQAFREHRYLQVHIIPQEKPGTGRQRRALHVFCDQLATVLNDAGMDMKRTLRAEAEIPWTQKSVKDYLWRPVQEAMTGKVSTTELSTVDPTAIHEALARHLAVRLGVECPPWPTKERQLEEGRNAKSEDP